TFHGNRHAVEDRHQAQERVGDQSEEDDHPEVDDFHATLHIGLLIVRQMKSKRSRLWICSSRLRSARGIGWRGPHAVWIAVDAAPVHSTRRYGEGAGEH